MYLPCSAFGGAEKYNVYWRPRSLVMRSRVCWLVRRKAGQSRKDYIYPESQELKNHHVGLEVGKGQGGWQLGSKARKGQPPTQQNLHQVYILHTKLINYAPGNPGYYYDQPIGGFVRSELEERSARTERVVTLYLCLSTDRALDNN